ncbi:MAG: hypothetical protein AB7E55_13980 [Pigmentiphaga sp.]
MKKTDEIINEFVRNFLRGKRTEKGLSIKDVADRSMALGILGTLDEQNILDIEDDPINADAIEIASYLAAIDVRLVEYYEILKIVDARILRGKPSGVP